MVSIQEEWMAKQRQIMGKIVDRGAHALQDRLFNETKGVAARIAKDLNIFATALAPPSGAKDIETARAKVNRDYGGDWLSIKDMARCTLVVQSEKYLNKAVFYVKAHFRASNGWSVFEEKVTVGALDVAGYSGLTIFVSSGGNKGEIQVNTPPLMYAKSLSMFRKSLGSMEQHMRASYPLVHGGLGHKLYEVYRVQPQTSIGRAHAHASKLYYNYFRSDPANALWGMAARDAINALGIVYID
jgi:hypothetical protein